MLKDCFTWLLKRIIAVFAQALMGSSTRAVGKQRKGRSGVRTKIFYVIYHPFASRSKVRPGAANQTKQSSSNSSLFLKFCWYFQYSHFETWGWKKNWRNGPVSGRTRSVTFLYRHSAKRWSSNLKLADIRQHAYINSLANAAACLICPVGCRERRGDCKVLPLRWKSRYVMWLRNVEKAA